MVVVEVTAQNTVDHGSQLSKDDEDDEEDEEEERRTTQEEAEEEEEKEEEKEEKEEEATDIKSKQPSPGRWGKNRSIETKRRQQTKQSQSKPN